MTNITANWLKRKTEYVVTMHERRRYDVYILASKSRVLYVGVTGWLMLRIMRHKEGRASRFTTKYHVNRLVWFQGFDWIENAIARETEIKAWRREKKIRLIEESNPTWEDLAADWGKSFILNPNVSRQEKQVPHR